jgi:hypothetical protein
MSNWDHEKWDKTVECFQRAYDIRSEIYGQALLLWTESKTNTQTRIKISCERWSHEQSHAQVRDTLRWLNKAKGRLGEQAMARNS